MATVGRSLVPSSGSTSSVLPSRRSTSAPSASRKASGGSRKLTAEDRGRPPLGAGRVVVLGGDRDHLADGRIECPGRRAHDLGRPADDLDCVVVAVHVRDEQEVGFGALDRRIVELHATRHEPLHRTERVDKDGRLRVDQECGLPVPTDLHLSLLPRQVALSHKVSGAPLTGDARGEQMIGGHAVVAVGYDDGIQRFIVRISWGTKWATRGYGTMPYGYLTDPQLARDFWAIYTVEQEPKAPRRRTVKRRKPASRGRC
jgi:papain like protease